MPTHSIVVENKCSREVIDPVYADLIEEAVAAYRDVFAERALDIRLMGSVARGEAVLGQSDIDFMALVQDAPSETERAAVRRHADRLGQEYPLVSRVDLDASRPGDLHPGQRFILSSDSLSLAGDDHLTRPRQTIGRRELADLVTLDRDKLIRDYRTALLAVAPEDTAQLLFWSRVVGKDLLKCLRGAVLREGGNYERNIAAIARQVAAHFPEHRAVIEHLFACYNEPTSERETLLRLLDATAHLPLDQH